MTLQLGMLRDQASEGFAHGFCRDLDRGLFPRILAKWRRNLDLGHVNKDAMVLAKDASGKLSDHTHLLVHKFLVGLVAANQFERIRNCRLALIHTRDHVRAAEPVGFRQVGGRPLRGMVGMGVIEADDVLAVLAAFALNADELSGIDLVAVLWRVLARVTAARYARNGLC